MVLCVVYYKSCSNKSIVVKIAQERIAELDRISEQVEEQSVRLGMDFNARGACESWACNFDDETGYMWICDDWASVDVDPDRIVEQLRSIPDGTDYYGVWDYLGSFEITNPIVD